MVKTVIRWGLEGMGMACLSGSLLMVTIGYALGAADTYGAFGFFTGILGMVGAGIGALNLSEKV
jgi:hypothetical protein